MTVFTWLLLILGFILLIKGADFFVDGASGLAKRFHVPTLIIGMTIVAIGTSLPETAVSITASAVGANSMAISNAVGSNIFNLLVVCGAAILITVMPVSEETLKRDFPISVICALALAGTGLIYYAAVGELVVGRIAGVLFLAGFVAFIVFMIKAAKKKAAEAAEEDDEKPMAVWKMAVFIVGGAAAVAWGGNLVVESAKTIASAFGMSDTLIGLTIVALGTSLPELVTGIMAARKNEIDIALGNVVGSNIFNILMVLGVAAVISPMQMLTENFIDMAVLVVMSIIVWIFAKTKKKLVRFEGVIMLLMYAAYLAYIIGREYMI